MSKRQSRNNHYSTKGHNKGSFMTDTYVNVTEHAIKRYTERIRNVNKRNAQRSIIEGVKRSRMIALTKYGGREIRESKGLLYVCELNGRIINVITILVSEVELRFVS